MLNKAGRIIVPILIHYLIGQVVLMLFYRQAGSAVLTSAAAAVTLPVMWYLYRQDQKQQPYSSEKSSVPWWGYPLAAVAGAAANWLFSSILVWTNITARFSNQVQEGLLQDHILVQILGLGLLVPILEEVLFRGIVYRRLKAELPKWGAVLLAALIFAVYHGNMIQILFAFPMAVLLILLYDKSKTLMIPVIFHVASNLAAILIL